jgi:DNA-binding GntR family transcriptional regulator
MKGSPDKKIIIDVTNISEKIYKLIKQRIIYLNYPPGQRIDMRQLQQELAVSQTPIKDALFRLAGEGMIEINPRKGTYIKEISERDVYEIEEARIIVETGAVELIADRISDDQLAELERLYEDTLFEDGQFDYRMFMEKDNLFHLKIVEFTQNQRLVEMYKHLNAHMQIVRFQFARGQFRRLPWTNQDHLGILNALKARDPNQAKEAIKEHRLKAREAFLQHRKEMEVALQGSG